MRLRCTNSSLLGRCEALPCVGALFSGWGAPLGGLRAWTKQQLLLIRYCHPAEKSLAEGASQAGPGPHSCPEHHSRVCSGCPQLCVLQTQLFGSWGEAVRGSVLGHGREKPWTVPVRLCRHPPVIFLFSFHGHNFHHQFPFFGPKSAQAYDRAARRAGKFSGALSLRKVVQ